MLGRENKSLPTSLLQVNMDNKVVDKKNWFTENLWHKGFHLKYSRDVLHVLSKVKLRAV